MQTLENYRPREGLSIPSITVLDENQQVIEEDQRRLFRYHLQSGFGADIVFGAGTTGEWNRVSNPQHRRVMEIEIDEIRRTNPQLERAGHHRVDAWVGVTGNSKEETLGNLEAALELGADAGVIAPLSIGDLPEIVPFFQRDITRLFETRGKCLPLFLYDNAEIATNPRVPHIRTRDVKMLSRLEYVRGIKVSASRKILGNYSKASLHFKQEREFGVYVGNAMLIFDIFEPTRGPIGKVREYWNLHLLHNAIPIGVVSGPANVFPREWQKTWRICNAGDGEGMSVYRQLHESFLQACVFSDGGAKFMKLVASIKHALHLEGVITSPRVAPGTPALSDEQKKVFAERYQRLKDQVRVASDSLWISRWEQVNPTLDDGRPGGRQSSLPRV